MPCKTNFFGDNLYSSCCESLKYLKCLQIIEEIKKVAISMTLSKSHGANISPLPSFERDITNCVSLEMFSFIGLSI